MLDVFIYGSDLVSVTYAIETDMLPELIPIPSEAASEFVVRGDCTGRDIAWSLVLLMQAVGKGEAGEVMLPDNRTRELLGLTRRDKIATETARWERLRDLRINGRPSPTVMFESIGGHGEWPLRHQSLDGELTIVVDQHLADRFTDRNGDVVYLPLRLLQLAGGRYTVPLFMRMLSWTIGDYPRAWRVQDTAKKVKLRLPLDYLRNMLDVPASLRPHQVVSRVLDPAAEEITLATDYEVSIVPRIAASSGRIRDIEITIHVPDVERAIEAMEDTVMRDGPWRRKDRPSRSRPERFVAATPVPVSRAALDAAVPLSVVRAPDSAEKTSDQSNSNHSPGSSVRDRTYGERETKIEW